MTKKTHQPPVPDKNIGFAKNPAANTIDVKGEGNWPPEPNSPTLQNMPYGRGQ